MFESSFNMLYYQIKLLLYINVFQAVFSRAVIALGADFGFEDGNLPDNLV